jgi:hypothetical protein
MSIGRRRIVHGLAAAVLGGALQAAFVTGAVGDEVAVAGAANDSANAAAAQDGSGVVAPAPRIKSHGRASSGKPVAPIAIGYEFSAEPSLGVPFDVRITARGGAGIADLALTVRAGDGLQAGTPQLITGSPDGAQRSWTVAATAFNEGTAYLSVLVTGTAGEQHPARDLLIPIRIGTAPPAKQTTSAEPKTDPTGERVIVLPAEGGH